MRCLLVSSRNIERAVFLFCFNECEVQRGGLYYMNNLGDDNWWNLKSWELKANNLGLEVAGEEWRSRNELWNTLLFRVWDYRKGPEKKIVMECHWGAIKKKKKKEYSVSRKQVSLKEGNDHCIKSCWLW